jgi:hypothetical protein
VPPKIVWAEGAISRPAARHVDLQTAHNVSFSASLSPRFPADKSRRRHDVRRCPRLTTTKGRQRHNHEIPGQTGRCEFPVWARFAPTAAGLLPCGRLVASDAVQHRGANRNRARLTGDRGRLVGNGFQGADRPSCEDTLKTLCRGFG